jgi:Radical SAM superfamily
LELKAVLPYARQFVEVPTLAFADSNLNASMKELGRFVELILEENIRITWGGQAHIHGNLTREFLEKMKKSGFSSVFWGIESGSQRVVDLMNKQYAQEDARRISDDCIELGIRQNIQIIIGYPGEEPSDVVDTLELILRFKNEPMVTVLLPGLLVVRPGSPLYEDYPGYGLANNLYYEWSTADGTNNLHVRIARIFYIKQAHGNEDLKLNGIVEPGEIEALKLNEEPVAVDIFSTILEACERAGSLRSFLHAIDNFDRDTVQAQPKAKGVMARIRSWTGNSNQRPDPVSVETWPTDEMEIGRPADAGTRADYLARWLKLDKDSKIGRQRLYEIMLLSIRSLFDKHKTAAIREDDEQFEQSMVSRAD